ncbi:MAG: AraC family transcriptional regulator [Clostridia bacterium]|nr:AraC family transcriptional regulator [Clostridia bacterium]
MDTQRGETQLKLITYPISSDVGISTHLVHDNAISQHKHEFYEIFYILSGQVTHYLNGKQSALSAGDCIILTPSDVHSIRSDPKVKSANRDIMISTELFEQICALVPSSLDFIRNSRGGNVHFSIQEIMEIEQSLSEFSREENVGRKRCVGISLLLKILHRVLEENQEKDGNDGSNTPRFIKKLIEDANKIHFIKKGLSAIIADCGYSHSYICRIFKQHMGISISDYLKNVRVAHVAYYLKTTDYSLQQIAEQVGIDSLSYLNKIFKEKYELSPIQYRKTYKPH